MQTERPQTVGLIPLLRVVPENGRADCTEAVRAAWDDFNHLIPNQPLTGVTTAHEPPWGWEIGSLAMAVPTPSLSGSLVEGSIVVSIEFLANERTDDERALTLLHESIHLRVMTTTPKRNVRMERTRREMDDQPRRVPRGDADFVYLRCISAMQFLNLPDEIWAELLLRDEYQDWLGRRMQCYTQMRERNFARREGSRERVPSRLHRYWLFYELLRVELGRSLAPDQEQRERLRVLANQWTTALYVACDDTVQADRLVNKLPALIPDDLEAKRVSEGPFNELFDEILAVDPFGK